MNDYKSEQCIHELLCILFVVVDESSPELYYLTIKKTTHPLGRTFT